MEVHNEQERYGQGEAPVDEMPGAVVVVGCEQRNRNGKYGQAHSLGLVLGEP